MLELLADATTQPSGGFRSWGTTEWLLIGGFICATLLPSIAAFWNSMRNKAQTASNKQTTQNLADAVRDVATSTSGQALPNISPETLPTLTNISRGGTGDGGSL